MDFKIYRKKYIVEDYYISQNNAEIIIRYENIKDYKLIIHCGACMLNEKQMQARMAGAKINKIPMTNYGIAIAYLNGILKRSIKPFGM